jgi:Ca2+-binding RTX toxin-like protein
MRAFSSIAGRLLTRPVLDDSRDDVLQSSPLAAASLSDAVRDRVLAPLANHAPVVVTPIADQTIPEHEFAFGPGWVFQVPAGTFSDPDGQSLTFTATLSDGSALPDWIQFDTATNTFTAHTPYYFNGEVDLKIIASDGQKSASDVFALNVTAVNDPPQATVLPDRAYISGEFFQFRFADSSFADPDGDTLTYTAFSYDGPFIQVPLPDWLKFDPETQVFSGTPPSNFAGTIVIGMVASDGTFSVGRDFQLNISGADGAPQLNGILPDQFIDEDTPFWTYATGFFASDPDGGGFNRTSLAYSASLAGNMPLPDWLLFNPYTASGPTFSGTPPKDFNGVLNIVIVADDGDRDVTTGFALHVQALADAPVVNQPLQDRFALSGLQFNLALPASAFMDPDGDSLSYTATLASGKALPGWLIFDPATLTFSGASPDTFHGVLDISVTASDGALTASDTFTLDVWDMDSPPVLYKQIPNQHLKAGSAFTYSVPANTFKDPDNPTLTWTATRDDGGALPFWLHFNPVTHIFSGTPPLNWTGPVGVKLTVSDDIATATDTFAFTGKSPIAVHPIDDQTTSLHRFWSFTVPADTFKDFDTRATALTYQATLLNNKPLPSWIKFDPDTLTFSGTPPNSWTGHSDIKLTVSDGKNHASDSFALDADGDFTYHITGSMWGRDAPSQIHYRFDPLYFQSSNSWSAGFDEGFSSGPIYGGVSGSVGFAYNFQAGLLADFTLKPDLFDLRESFDLQETTGPFAINGNPSVTVTGHVNDHTSFNLSTPDDGFLLHLFAGITATANAFLKGSVYGGFDTPDLPFIDIPDINFNQGFGKTINFPGIGKIDISNGQITKPDGDIGAIEVNIKTGDDPFMFDVGDDGIGHITIGPPTGISTDVFTIDNIGANGLGTLNAGGTSEPFLSATLDLDALAVKAVPELKALFHAELMYNLGGFYVGANIDSDFALVGDLSLRETLSFTPQIYYTMSTSFGQTVTGQAGQQTVFDTPEGEGTFTVNAAYTSEADLTTTISLVGNIHFDMTLLKATLFAGVGVDPINFTFGDISLPAAYDNTFNIIGAAIELFSATDHYVLGQTRSDSFVESYEKFRTVAGSGDNFTLTTHQVTADGNGDANQLTGNALDNTINGFGGNDVLVGGGGRDTLDGGDGDDLLSGGTTMTGGAGNDTITLGAGGGTLFGDDGDDQITGGDGDNTIFGGSGNDVIVSGSGSGGSFVYGNDGNDRIVLLDEAPSEARDGADGGFGDDLITGGNVAGSYFGGDGNDTITGGASGDLISGGDGSDIVKGGSGNDVLYGEIEGANDSTYVAGSHVDSFVFTLGSGNDSILDLNYHFADTITSQDRDIVDLTGFYSITGKNNIAVVDDGFGQVKLVLSATDSITLAGFAFNPDDSRQVLSSIKFKFFDPAGPDLLIGTDGNDVLDGGAGADTMTGLKGNDTYKVDNAGDKVIEKDGEGADVILATVSYTLALHQSVETIQAANQAGNIDFAGNELANTLIGNDGINLLTGGGGNDILQGGNGGDVLTGGAGTDTLKGGADGDDFVFVHLSDSAAAAPDKITDFETGIDKIDLSAIDADATLAGDQHFQIVMGTVAGEGQAAIYASGSSWFVDLNVNGDAAIEMRIQLTNNHPIGTGDFLV